MNRLLRAVRSRLLLKITIPVAGILFAIIFLWSRYHIEYQQRAAQASLITGADRVANAVKLGLRYAMMLNAREDIQASVDDFARHEEIHGIRILNKAGEVMFASDRAQRGRVLAQESSLCLACHAGPRAATDASPGQRIYADAREGGEHLLRLTSPILNEPGCSAESACHFHGRSEEHTSELQSRVDT